MVHCTRKGCGQEFSEETNTGKCTFHSGAPVFHEGLKSWSCCADVHKPVLDFDDFMKIPGCTEIDGHTTEKPKVESPKPAAPSSNSFATSQSADGKETYSTGALKPRPSASLSSMVPETSATVPPVVDEEDDISVAVKPGTHCRRKGCGVAFVDDKSNRLGDGPGTVCTYHPLPPVFHEGSKGYLCCKRRVLEFDEFLKIRGCKTGRHLFAPRAKDSTSEEMVTCRIDHYQTPQNIHASIFAKQVDKERSSIAFEPSQIHVDLYLPGNKRFRRVVELFGPIDPEKCSYRILGTKVELNLQKKDNRSWTLLEKTDQNLGNISLTFGVGGRTGTVGGKEIIR